MTDFLRGQVARITATFKTNNVLVDPTVVLFRHRNPAGTVVAWTYGTDSQVVKTSTGIYYVDLVLSTEGAWYWRWESTGTGQAAEESSILVGKGNF